jgi:hypothetical protein
MWDLIVLRDAAHLILYNRWIGKYPSISREVIFFTYQPLIFAVDPACPKE